jgi:putative oxidoreductase
MPAIVRDKVGIRQAEILKDSLGGKSMARLIGSEISMLGSLGLLVVRVCMGAAFIIHGWDKINGPNGMMAWMQNPDVPGWLQAVAAISEFGGGILLVLGFLTPLASLAIVGVMVGALSMVHLKAGHPFVDVKGGQSCELAAIYLAAATLLFFMGPGAISVDGLLFRRKRADMPPPAYR